MIIYKRYFYKYKLNTINYKKYFLIKIMPIFIQNKLYKIFLYKSLLIPRINVSNKKKLFLKNIYFKKRRKKFYFFSTRSSLKFFFIFFKIKYINIYTRRGIFFKDRFFLKKVLKKQN